MERSKLNIDQYRRIPEISIRIPSVEEEQAILRLYLPNQEWDLTELQENREKGKIVLLEFGSKSLLLYLEYNGEFVTVVANMGKEKVEGDTYMVYRKAQELMQQEADQQNRKFLYTLSTKDKKMISWAQNKGKTIFQWTKVEEPREKGKDWIFTTIITPQQREQNY